MAGLAKAGALGASAAIPVALRTVDSPGAGITRPSVAVPVLLGGGLTAAGMLVDSGTISAPISNQRTFSDLATESGLVMLGAAVGNVVSDGGL